MPKQSNLFQKLGWTAVFLLMFGVGSWRQYLKFTDGRGLGRWLVPVDASVAVQILVFVLIPVVAALAIGWAMARDTTRDTK